MELERDTCRRGFACDNHVSVVFYHHFSNEGTKVQNPRRVHCIYNVQLIYTRINIHGNIHVHTRTNA